jgi:hypothetical protein
MTLPMFARLLMEQAYYRKAVTWRLPLTSKVQRREEWAMFRMPSSKVGHRLGASIFV